VRRSPAPRDRHRGERRAAGAAAAALLAAPLYGLRTWRWVADAEGERLTSVQQRGTPWPDGGAWLDAVCRGGAGPDGDPGHAGDDPHGPDGDDRRPGAHDAPAPGCGCGVHAWHPRPASARLVLAGRFTVPGVVEATGAIQVHHEGFRAARARPHALFLLPGRNGPLVRRLGERYGVPVVPVARPTDVLAWCRERGLGLDEAVVDELIGGGEERRRARRRRRRADALRVAAAIAVSVGLFVAGHQVADDGPGPHERWGRTGKFVAR
jgi:hypothetical protein